LRPTDEKRVERLYAQVVKTRTNCSYGDLERLLLAVGFIVRDGSGSHRIFRRGSDTLVVPKRKPVKRPYVERALRMIENQ
jgi:predicted RNA binding protein YcfA (HicA-like mRNA interferase family)